MPDADTLRKLSEWYAEQCDGKWEHGPGVGISTVDNPGWHVKINLKGTNSEECFIHEVDFDKSDNDWLKCFKKEGQFVGAGDPSKLTAILEHFLTDVGKL